MTSGFAPKLRSHNAWLLTATGCGDTEHGKKTARNRLGVDGLRFRLAQAGRRKFPLRHPALRRCEGRVRWRMLLQALVEAKRKTLVADGRAPDRHAHQPFRLRDA